jgi:hypothetical protein
LDENQTNRSIPKIAHTVRAHEPNVNRLLVLY